MLNKTQAGLALAISLVAGATQAADFSFSGVLLNNNDVAQVGFTLDVAATNVRVWTDSFQNFANFDPIAAVWAKSGSDYRKIAENDDTPTIFGPGQTGYDAGMWLGDLAAGDYKITITDYPNWAQGFWLSEGFWFDGRTPRPVAAGKGHWSVHLVGVDVLPTTAVPEPHTWALMLGGLALGLRSRRRAPQR